MRIHIRLACLVVAVVTLALPGSFVHGQQACGSNPIVCENQLAGSPPEDWDISGAGDARLQGFATEISVDKGETVHFKIDTTAAAFDLAIYRLGYYGGNGARLIASQSDLTGVRQPPCLTQSSTGLLDCGNWAESASWEVPATAVSGIYVAKLTTAGSGGSHIVFVVRDDETPADVIVQTSDTTWQAYNTYGGNSLYVGGPGVDPGRAYKVSYNRPITTRGTTPEDFVFNAEYPMVRWLEANGYNVSYMSGADTDRYGATELTRHRVFLAVGHDEYWSAAQRHNVETARDSGVSLGFFTGNGIFWKTRWEPSIDGSGAPYRTLVSYKETHANAPIDPQDPPTWTGTWRDPRFSPPADGGRPENAVTGTLFTVNWGGPGSERWAIKVPQTFASRPFWRNTRVATLAPGTTATLAAGTLGYEWDENPNNGYRPAGLTALSSTKLSVAQKLLDYGSTYGPGTATHALTLYHNSSNTALVFGAGTVQWAWGLDGHHDRGGSTPDLAMQQATVNLLYDMGVEPATLQPDLVPGGPPIHEKLPSSAITFPTAGAALPIGVPVTVAGVATGADADGVTLVDVSTDGGATWHRASGTSSWSYVWTPGTAGPVTLKSRATDDDGREIPSAGVTVNVIAVPATCPCSIWSLPATPGPMENDAAAVELGVKFRADAAGVITGLRFYKYTQNTGQHTGHLWTTSGQLLGTVTFSSESASGWQQAMFATPVAIAANTIYIASYHTSTGFYASTEMGFATGVDSAPLHALADGASGGNGVYRYGASSAFPNQTWNASNYWVDVVFTGGSADTTPPAVIATTPQAGASSVAPSSTVTATFSEAMQAATITTASMQLNAPGQNPVAAAVVYDAAAHVATLTPSLPLASATTFTATVKGGTSGVKDAAGNALASDVTWTFTTAAANAGSFSLWSVSAMPGPMDSEAGAVELGVKFQADVGGFVTGVRFYKYAQNTGTHVGHLWNASGQLLATVTFSDETASGWQEATFATPVAIGANTVYVVSYHTNTGFYASTVSGLAAAVNSPPLHAPADSECGGNGVYRYGASTGFPDQTWSASNYWVDLVFTPGP